MSLLYSCQCKRYFEWDNNSHVSCNIAGNITVIQQATALFSGQPRVTYFKYLNILFVTILDYKLYQLKIYTVKCKENVNKGCNSWFLH